MEESLSQMEAQLTHMVHELRCIRQQLEGQPLVVLQDLVMHALRQCACECDSPVKRTQFQQAKQLMEEASGPRSRPPTKFFSRRMKDVTSVRK